MMKAGPSRPSLTMCVLICSGYQHDSPVQLPIAGTFLFQAKRAEATNRSTSYDRRERDDVITSTTRTLYIRSWRCHTGGQGSRSEITEEPRAALSAGHGILNNRTSRAVGNSCTIESHRRPELPFAYAHKLSILDMVKRTRHVHSEGHHELLLFHTS